MLTFVFFCSLPPNTNGDAWREHFGSIRAKGLARLAPGFYEKWKLFDPIATGFVDPSDPLEVINFITLYLPGMLFVLNAVWFCGVPHVFNFLVFMPIMWYFDLPCLYSFNKLLATGNFVEGTASTGPCEPVRVSNLVAQVFKSLTAS